MKNDLLNNEAYKELIMPVDTNIKLSSVILSDENKAKIAELVRELKHSEELISAGLPPMNRLLMTGDSGTGKTFTGKALSNHLGYTMLYIDIAKALSGGNISKNLADIFDLANNVGKCIIFLDECDSIAMNREENISGDNRITNSLFQLADQMNPINILVSASNLLHKLDPAFKRRFNMEMVYRNPEGDLDPYIQRFIFHDKGFTYKKDLTESDNTEDRESKEIADRRLSVSYDAIEGAVKRTMKECILNQNGREVRQSEVYRKLLSIGKVRIRLGILKNI